MKKKLKKSKLTALLLALSLVSVFLSGGCQSKNSGSKASTGAESNTEASGDSASQTTDSDSTAAASSSEASADTSGEVRTVTVAHSQNGKPTAYTDDNGNLTGYDIEALRLVDELLPQYEFEYVGLDQTAIYAGLSSGKYQIAVTNSFYTTERAEKYLFPKENLGASVLGIYTNKEKYPDVKSLEEAATQKLNIVPILAGDGIYYVVATYNKNHPDNQVILTPTDDNNAFTESFQWVAEGRYDFGLVPQQYWDALVAAEDGAYHQYYDKLTFTVFDAVKTWSILAKGEEELADALDGAIAQLKNEGKLSELSKKFYNGVDNFTYLTADSE